MYLLLLIVIHLTVSLMLPVTRHPFMLVAISVLLTLHVTKILLILLKQLVAAPRTALIVAQVCLYIQMDQVNCLKMALGTLLDTHIDVTLLFLYLYKGPSVPPCLKSALGAARISLFISATLFKLTHKSSQQFLISSTSSGRARHQLPSSATLNSVTYINVSGPIVYPIS